MWIDAIITGISAGAMSAIGTWIANRLMLDHIDKAKNKNLLK